jgi:hypothetical protein
MIILAVKNLWQVWKLGQGKTRNTIQFLIHIFILIGYVIQKVTVWIPSELFEDTALTLLVISWVFEGMDLMSVRLSSKPATSVKKDEVEAKSASKPISMPIKGSGLLKGSIPDVSSAKKDDVEKKKSKTEEVKAVREIDPVALGWMTFALSAIAYFAVLVVTNDFLTHFLLTW